LVTGAFVTGELVTGAFRSSMAGGFCAELFPRFNNAMRTGWGVWLPTRNTAILGITWEVDLATAIAGVASGTVEELGLTAGSGVAKTDGDHTRGSDGEDRGSGTAKDSSSSAVGELARHPGG